MDYREKLEIQFLCKIASNKNYSLCVQKIEMEIDVFIVKGHCQNESFGSVFFCNSKR